MSELVLSSFGGILPKVVALFEFRFFISVSILETVTCSKEKPATTGKRVRIVFMLGWFACFSIAFSTGSMIPSVERTLSRFSAIPRVSVTVTK